jgi:hypothetical protein
MVKRWILVANINNNHYATIYIDVASHTVISMDSIYCDANWLILQNISKRFIQFMTNSLWDDKDLDSGGWNWERGGVACVSDFLIGFKLLQADDVTVSSTEKFY